RPRDRHRIVSRRQKSRADNQIRTIENLLEQLPDFGSEMLAIPVELDCGVEALLISDQQAGLDSGAYAEVEWQVHDPDTLRSCYARSSIGRAIVYYNRGD